VPAANTRTTENFCSADGVSFFLRLTKHDDDRRGSRDALLQALADMQRGRWRRDDGRSLYVANRISHCLLPPATHRQFTLAPHTAVKRTLSKTESPVLKALAETSPICNF